MNFFEIFDKNDDIKLIKSSGTVYTLKEIMALVKPIVSKLKQDDRKSAVIISDNNFDFFINFLAAIFAGKEIFLLTDKKKLFLLDFDYILLDEADTAGDFFCKIEKPDYNSTFINIFTSGSSGKPEESIGF